MSVSVIVGAQWGDEGKGKIVDLYSQNADIVARYQGGANAGHTLVIDGTQYVLHLIPSGILRPGVRCVIGNGAVIDPEALIREIEMLHANGVDTEGRLFISHKAHLIMPYHKQLDTAHEHKMESQSIGTTGRGIGPAYIDKFARCGIRIVDLLDRTTFEEKLRANLKEKNTVLQKIYGRDELNVEEIVQRYLEFDQKIDAYITDTTLYLNEAIARNERILAEGAQGALLDVDHGTYPFVTSSNPTSGAACTGLGIPPTAVNKITGVVKAYSTRVGNGPFPTELLDDTGDKLREMGGEFGTTTGRPRRCGWLDLAALKYSILVNGITEIALTKLDVLDTFDELRVCVGYTLDGKAINGFPVDVGRLESLEVELETLPGWNCSLQGIRSFEKLPQAARNYIERIEEYTGARIRCVSLSPDRKDTIIRD